MTCEHCGAPTGEQADELAYQLDMAKRDVARVTRERDALMRRNEWNDIAILLEGVGTLAAILRLHGHTHHNGTPLNQYLHEYLDGALADYDRSHIKGEEF